VNRIATRLLAVLVPAALFLPAAAHAATVVIDDASGDAKAPNIATELLFGTPSEGPELYDAPAETSTDIVRTTIDHATRRLTLTVQLRDLVETSEHSVIFRLTTPDARYDLAAGRSGDRTVSDLSPTRFVTSATHDGPLHRPCRTVRARYDLGADTVTASVPTSCIGSPKWVQVAAVATRIKVTPQGDGSVNLAAFVDDAFRGGVSAHSLGRSPKVRRG
jgi:hypothetical protein